MVGFKLSEQHFIEIVATLREILKWTRFAGMQQLRRILAENLTTSIELLTYETSDGTRGARDVARIAGISHPTVLSYWKKWAKIGIVEPSLNAREGRYQRICSLEEVVLTSPPLPQLGSESPPSIEQEEEGKTK